MPPTLSTNQRIVLNLIAAPFLTSGTWPTWGYVDAQADQAGMSNAADVLRGLPAGLTVPETASPNSLHNTTERLGLTTLGLSLCDGTAEVLGTFVAALRKLSELEQGRDVGPDDDGTLTVFSTEIQSALDLSSIQTQQIGALLWVEPQISSSGGSDANQETWNVQLSSGIRRFRGVESRDDYLAIRDSRWGIVEEPIDADEALDELGRMVGSMDTADFNEAVVQAGMTPVPDTFIELPDAIDVYIDQLGIVERQLTREGATSSYSTQLNGQQVGADTAEEFTKLYRGTVNPLSGIHARYSWLDPHDRVAAYVTADVQVGDTPHVIAWGSGSQEAAVAVERVLSAFRRRTIPVSRRTALVTMGIYVALSAYIVFGRADDWLIAFGVALLGAASLKLALHLGEHSRRIRLFYGSRLDQTAGRALRRARAATAFWQLLLALIPVALAVVGWVFFPETKAK